MNSNKELLEDLGFLRGSPGHSRTVQAPHNWTVNWREHISKAERAANGLNSLLWVLKLSCVTSYCLILEVSWAKSEIQYWLIDQRKQFRFCLWKGYATHPSQCKQDQPHQSYSDHFPDATNKGMHSLSVYHKMTTKAIQSFLLRDASRYWQKLNSVFLRLLWFSTLSKQDTIYIKILLIQVQKNPTLLFFITKFVGGETLTFIFSFSYGTLYGSEKVLYLAS